MSATLDAVVHLGTNYVWILQSTKNQAQRTIKQLFDVSQKLITDQTEIQRVSKIGWHSHSWQRTSLVNDKAVQLSTAKAYVLFSSVLCLGKMHQHLEAIDARREKNEWFKATPQYRELERIDGGPIEFELQISPGFTTLQILAEIQKTMGEMRCEPEHLHVNVQ